MAVLRTEITVLLGSVTRGCGVGLLDVSVRGSLLVRQNALEDELTCGFSAVAALDSGAYATMEPSVKLQYACGGIVVAGLLYVILAAVIKLVGVKKVMRFLPPVVTGPIIILIGLNLAPNAVSNASSCWWLALLSIAVIVAANIWGKGMVKIIPILLGVVIPYLVAVAANALGATATR